MRTKNLIGKKINIEIKETIHKCFEEQVAKTPDSVALVFEKTLLTYQELDNKCNQVANFLIKKGIKKGDLVGIYIERSWKYVTAILGIMKSGGVYVPLNPEHPLKRNRQIIIESDLKIIVTEKDLSHHSIIEELNIICLDSDTLHECTKAVHVDIIGKDLAYVIFTSGSTGVPKGVQIAHNSVINLIKYCQELFKMTKDDRFLSLSTFTFDISVLELFVTLFSGSTLVIANYHTTKDSKYLARLIKKEHITIMQATPATWFMLLDGGWEGGSLKILSGAEALTRKLADRLLDKGSGLWNLYGPTETTIYSAISCITKNDKPITIGNPVFNTSLYILDKELKMVDVGNIGELYIGGIGLAKGYLYRPDLNTERFITLHSGERVYKTGDLVRSLPEHEIEFIGRMDFQVKIRGHRIELEEIESFAEQHNKVNLAIAVVKGNSINDKRIVLYYSSDAKTYELKGEIREHLEKTLPSYMIPSNIIFLEDFPLNITGKIDRKELTESDTYLGISNKEMIPPTSDMEINVAQIWCEMLELEEICINENFLELGGHSLIANRLNARINDFYGIDIGIVEMFKGALTVSSMVELIENKLISGLSPDQLLAALKELESY